MYYDNEDAICKCIEDTIKEIWIVIRLVLGREARQSDIEKAVEQAGYLRLYICSYEAREYNKLPATSIWLAKEVAEAVEDLID